MLYPVGILTCIENFDKHKLLMQLLYYEQIEIYCKLCKVNLERALY